MIIIITTWNRHNPLNGAYQITILFFFNYSETLPFIIIIQKKLRL